MLQSEPEFYEFGKNSIFIWEFKRDSIRRFGGVLDAEKLVQECVMGMIQCNYDVFLNLLKQNKTRLYSYGTKKVANVSCKLF